jgi:4-hydroxythreonine-4-phosphate dehydrogenase
VCLGDRALLAERARQLHLPVKLLDYVPGATPLPHVPGTLAVAHQPLAVPSVAGRPDVRNARYVLTLLDLAIDGALTGEFAALVTAPVQKSLLNEAGIAFSGHTEYLATRAGGGPPVMLLTGGELRVALATTHLPLARVSGALSVESLCHTLATLAQALEGWWGIRAPRIAVCGLNPHAGEGGHLGEEELTIIQPALERARARGLNVHGPLPADTVFVPRILKNFDAVLAMYHDQGLPVIKHVAFERAVNVTLGLPILRTSPDHGTALDLAGTGSADAGSLGAALRLASHLAAQRHG